jgi:hypothetical protein
MIHFNIIILSTPGSPKCSVSLRFPHQKACMHLFPIRATCPPHLFILDLITRIILGEEYRSLSSLCSLQHCPIRPKYSPQHPVLKHPQPTFLPPCERPSLTPIQNNR